MYQIPMSKPNIFHFVNATVYWLRIIKGTSSAKLDSSISRMRSRHSTQRIEPLVNKTVSTHGAECGTINRNPAKFDVEDALPMYLMFFDLKPTVEGQRMILVTACTIDNVQIFVIGTLKSVIIKLVFIHKMETSIAVISGCFSLGNMPAKAAS